MGAFRRRRGSRGQTTVEYLLLLACVASECGAFFVLMSKAMPAIFGKIECMVNNVSACPWP